jgi:hypothetical protein
MFDPHKPIGFQLVNVNQIGLGLNLLILDPIWSKPLSLKLKGMYFDSSWKP